MSETLMKSKYANYLLKYSLVSFQLKAFVALERRGNVKLIAFSELKQTVLKRFPWQPK